VHKRVISLLVAVVAMGGFTLAAFIPGALAQKADASTYCEYTEYSQYGEYCETTTPTTTVINGTTTTVTSSTIVIPPGAAQAPVSLPTGASEGKASIALGANGIASIDMRSLKSGQRFTANGVTIIVGAKTKDGFIMSFGGVSLDVPLSAVVLISKDGSVSVTYFKNASGKILGDVKSSHAVFRPLAVTGQQDVILPKGKSTNTVSYGLSKGVSFGAKTTWAQIAKAFTIQTIAAKPAKVAFTVSANKARTSVTIKLAKSERSVVVKFNVAKLAYSAAEKTYILKHKVKTLSAKFTVKATTGKKSQLDVFAFGYPV
jgi:hypothetical protein